MKMKQSLEWDPRLIMFLALAHGRNCRKTIWVLVKSHSDAIGKMYKFPRISPLPALLIFLTVLSSCASQKDVVLSSEKYMLLPETTSTTLPATASTAPASTTTATIHSATTYVQNSSTMTAMSVVPAPASISESDLKALYDKVRRARIAIDEYDIKFLLSDRYAAALTGYDSAFFRYVSIIKRSPYDGAAAYSVGEALKVTFSALSSLKVEENAVYTFIFRNKALSAKTCAAKLPNIEPDKARFAAAEIWFSEGESQRAGGNYDLAIDNYDRAAAAYSLSFGKALAVSQKEAILVRGYAVDFHGLVALADSKVAAEEAIWLQASNGKDTQNLSEGQVDLSEANLEYSAIIVAGKNYDAWTARNQAFAEKSYTEAIKANVDGALVYDSNDALLSQAESDFAAQAYEKASAEFKSAEAVFNSLSLTALSNKNSAAELLSRSKLSLEASMKKAAAEGLEQNLHLQKAKNYLEESKTDFGQARYLDSMSKSRLSIVAADDSDAFVGIRIAKMAELTQRLALPPKTEPAPSSPKIQASVSIASVNPEPVPAAPVPETKKGFVPKSASTSQIKISAEAFFKSDKFAFSPNEPESISAVANNSGSGVSAETSNTQPAPAPVSEHAVLAESEYAKTTAPPAQVKPAPAPLPAEPQTFVSAQPEATTPAPAATPGAAAATAATANSAATIALSTQKWALSRNAQNNYPIQYKEACLKLEAAQAALKSSEYKSALQLFKESSALFRAIPEYAVLPAQYKVRYIGGSRDTFIKISGYSFVYNDSSQWKTIYEANKQILPIPSNPDLLYPGTILSIPNLRGEKREGLWDPMKTYAPLGE
jgi:nucleoid-associated protein YgaU